MARRQEPHEGRERLIEAAAEIFAQVGFAGASVGEIARVAGVTQPLVNHHFGTKKGLWQAVVDARFTALQTALDAVETRSADLPEHERLRALLYEFVVFTGRHPTLSRMLRLEADGELAREVAGRWTLHFVAFLEARLDRAVKAGVLAPLDPRLLYFFIVGAATELFAQPAVAKRAFKLDVADPKVVDRQARFVCDFVLRGASLEGPATTPDTAR